MFPGRSPCRALVACAAVALIAGAGTALAPAPAAAQGLRAMAAPVQPQSLVRAEIRPGWTTPSGSRMAALHLRLAEGWKTYWRIPGEAGIAPRFDWSGSQNLAEVRLHWPQPEVFDQAGYRSIGYRGELVLPIELVPRRAGRPIVLDGALALGVCDEICVPVDLTVGAVLRGSGAPDPAIARALAAGPQPATRAGLGAVRCAIEPAARGMRLSLRAALPRQGSGETVVLELPGQDLWVSDQRSWREGGQLVAEARVRAPGGEAVAIDRSAVAFTVLGGAQMLEHTGCTGD